MPDVPSADSPLSARAEAALAGTGQRTAVFTHEGSRFVVKRLAERPRRLPQTLLLRWLARRVTGQPLPLATLALTDAAHSMDYEARRLRTLAGAGVRVPRVRLATPAYLVLDHCGTVAATLLEGWDAATWRQVLPTLAAELGELHRAGLWHGGAQIKNVTLADGVSWRIDFEENFGEFLPLPVTQAVDLALFLNSISLAGPIDEAEARHLLPILIARYRAAHPDPELFAVLARALPWLRRLLRLARPFRSPRRKGVRRVEILYDVLRDACRAQA